MDSVLHAAANTADDFPGGITGMATAIGKNKFSLAHELSGTGTAKLGLVDALKMVKRSGDWRILNAAAEQCGGLFIPLHNALPIAGGTFGDLGKLASEFADLVREITSRASDGEISDNDIAEIDREWSELVTAGQILMGHLRNANEQLRSRRQQPTPLKAA